MTTTQDAIRQHGARAVYQAAIDRLQGNARPLASIGLSAPDLAEANRIMSAAFAELGPADRAIDKASAQAKLDSHG